MATVLQRFQQIDAHALPRRREAEAETGGNGEQRRKAQNRRVDANRVYAGQRIGKPCLQGGGAPPREQHAERAAREGEKKKYTPPKTRGGEERRRGRRRRPRA